MMRFFLAISACCLLAVCVGCNMTQNWSGQMFPDDAEIDKLEPPKKNFWNSKFGEMSGLDPRSREIEERLGY